MRISPILPYRREFFYYTSEVAWSDGVFSSFAADLSQVTPTRPGV